MMLDELDYDIEEVEQEEILADNELRAKYEYGPVLAGSKCTIIDSGYDWFRVKNNGRYIYVPNWVF